MKSNLRFSFVAILAAGAMVTLSGSARANLVANGNFDLDTPPGGTAPMDWSFTPASSGSDFFVGPMPTFGAFSGPNSANFGAVGDLDDVLWQNIATTAGQTYTISFELAHNSSNAENDFSVQFGGVTVFSIANQSQFGYTLETVTGTATSSSTLLSFSGREVPQWYGLDNVSVSSGVPEPSTWAMLILGFAGLGFAGHRRTKARSVSFAAA